MQLPYPLAPSFRKVSLKDDCYNQLLVRLKTPHPALRADLSPKGEVWHKRCHSVPSPFGERDRVRVFFLDVRSYTSTRACAWWRPIGTIMGVCETGSTTTRESIEKTSRTSSSVTTSTGLPSATSRPAFIATIWSA